MEKNNMITIEGEIEEIIFRNENNGYTVCIMRNDDTQITVIGNLFNVFIGEVIKVTGSWIVHPSYGEQFKAESCERTVPKSEDAIMKFLGSGVIKGIRESTAKKIINKFGDQALEIIKNNPERLSEIKGISHEKAISIGQAFNDYGQIWEVSLFLQKYGVSPAFVNKIYTRFGESTIKIVKENPYRLADEISGLGFKTVDKIAMSMGADPHCQERAASCLLYILLKFAVEGGNVFLPAEKLYENTASLLGMNRDMVREACSFLLKNGKIIIDTSVDGSEKVFLKALYNAENNIAKKLVELSFEDFRESLEIAERYITVIEEEQGIKLAEKQIEAVKEAIVNGAIIITGGPGTGKTTIIKTIVGILEKMGITYTLAAPTGRAAKRLSEATGSEAKTLHRLLELGRSGDESSNLLETNRSGTVILEDVVIVDETSMIDVILMNQLLEAMPVGTRLILVGDADQLPAVGPGNVLKDIISSGVIKVVRLTEIFRQARESMIIINAHQINNGNYPEYNTPTDDFYIARSNTENDILRNIISICSDRLKKHRGFDGFRDIQVLTPTKKGIIGVKNINIELQKVLNPPSKNKTEKIFHETVFREGDKVMQIKNNYDLVWRKSGNSGEYGFGIFNGDIGIIDEIDNHEGIIRVLFDDRIVEYNAETLNELESAYAITVHKSQGSEFPAVVMPVFRGMPLLTNRNLLYTAITRAKEMVVIVGKEKDVEYMIDNCVSIKRYSSLSEKIVASVVSN